MSRFDISRIHDPIFRSAFWNLMNGIIGSGILALPYVMANLGYVLCTLVMIFVGFLTAFSIGNILLCCQKSNIFSYEKLSYHYAGSKGKFLTILMIWMHTVIAMCTYVTVVKQQLPELFMVPLQLNNSCVDKDAIWLNGNFICSMVTLFVILPLCSLKKVDMLSFTSSLAMLLMGFFSLILCAFQWKIKCPFEEASFDVTIDVESGSEKTGVLGGNCLDWDEVRKNNSKEYEPFTIIAQNITDHLDRVETCYISSVGNLASVKAASAFPNLVFSFMCITTVFPIFGDLLEAVRKQEEGLKASFEPRVTSDEVMAKSKEIMMAVTKFTLSIVCVVYLMVAFFGYNIWKEATVTSDILLPFGYTSPGNAWVITARVCSLVTVIFSAPLLHYPSRRALTVLLFKYENDPNDEEKFSWAKHLLVMAINLSIVIFLVVFFGNSLGQLFTYSGAVCANYLLLIMPSFLFIKAFETNSATGESSFQSSNASNKQIITIADEERIHLKNIENVEQEGKEPCIPKTRLLLCKILGIFGVAFLIFTVSLEIWKSTRKN